MMTSRTPKELIAQARTHKLIHSRKTLWCDLEEILALIQEPESKPVEKNTPDGRYYQQKVIYRGYEFIAATPEPLQYPPEKV